MDKIGNDIQQSVNMANFNLLTSIIACNFDSKRKTYSEETEWYERHICGSTGYLVVCVLLLPPKWNRPWLSASLLWTVNIVAAIAQIAFHFNLTTWH